MSPAELLSAPIYEALRARCVDAFIELRRRRRVRVSEGLSVLFEGRETVLLQVYEVLRAEGWDPARARRELAGYTCLVPGPGRLTATAMIDGGDPAIGLRLARALRARGGLVLGGAAGLTRSEPSGDDADDGPVHYRRVPIAARLAAAIVDGRRLTRAVDAPGLAAEVELAPALVRELAFDLDPTPLSTPLMKRPDLPCADPSPNLQEPEA
ncbi:MAG: DUF3501 family protein [Nannocystaceae bacterium]